MEENSSSTPQRETADIPIKKSEAEIMREEREKLKAENDLMEGELLRREQLRAQAVIAGKSQGAVPIQPETADEKWRREAKTRYKGTGLDPT